MGIILSGGPSSVYDKNAPHADKSVFDLGIPVLGICYGLQFMVYALGGKVTPAAKREYGHAQVEMQDADSQLFRGLPKLLAVWMSHGDSAEELPAGFRLTAKNSACRRSNRESGAQNVGRAVSSGGSSHSAGG